jgi:hypothetical protein
VYGYASSGGTGVYGLTDSANSIAVKGRVLNGHSDALTAHFLGAPVKIDSGCVGCFAPSDLRLKRDIQPIDYSLATVLALETVSFAYNVETYGSDTHLGFIAQDVQQVIPELVTSGEDGYLHLDYNGMIPVLVNAIQEQQAEIDALRASLPDTAMSAGEPLGTATALAMAVALLLALGAGAIGHMALTRRRPGQASRI